MVNYNATIILLFLELGFDLLDHRFALANQGATFVFCFRHMFSLIIS